MAQIMIEQTWQMRMQTYSTVQLFCLGIIDLLDRVLSTSSDLIAVSVDVSKLEM